MAGGCTTQHLINHNLSKEDEVGTNPKNVSIYGRLSFPTFTAAEAYERSQKGQYPAKDVGSASPDFLLLVAQGQWERFYNHVTTVFLPYCKEQSDKGEKRDALDAKEVKALLDGLAGDLADQVYNTPAKPVHEKSAELAPEAVATIKCIGPKGGTIDQKAIVRSESELVTLDPDLIIPERGIIMPIGDTKHEMYPGAVVAATLNLYAYHNGKHPGFSAGVTTAVFKADADRFGGGMDVDSDEIFLD